MSSNVAEIKIRKFKSAYIIFSSEERKILKEKFPELGNPSLTKMIAQKWKILNDFEKQKYYEEEKIEKQKFAYLKESLNLKYKYKKSEKLKKPIRFRTAYMFYIMDHKIYLNNKDKYKNIHFIKLLSQKWKSMNYEQKKIYNEKANLDKKRYEYDWEKYIKIYIQANKKKSKNLKIKTDINNDIESNNNLDNSEDIYVGKGKNRNKIRVKKLVFEIEKVSSKRNKINNENNLGNSLNYDIIKKEEGNFD